MKKIKAFFQENMLWNLFWCFLKVGMFTVGGGMAMIPVLTEKICDKYKWMTTEEMLDCIAVSQSLPGVVAVNMATYVGYRKKGFLGALVSTIGVILPSFIIIILVVSILKTVDENVYVQGALEGIKAAATGLMAFVAYKMGNQILTGPFQYALAVMAFVAIGLFGVSAVLVILASVILGETYFAIKMKQDVKQGGQG